MFVFSFVEIELKYEVIIGIIDNSLVQLFIFELKVGVVIKLKLNLCGFLLSFMLNCLFCKDKEI